jgi:cytochrome b subunit of formate dehydrogenase
MSQENDHDILIRMDQKLTDVHTELLGESGRVPKVEKEVKKQGEQIHFWRGALALAGFIILVFGVILWAHISGGK